MYEKNFAGITGKKGEVARFLPWDELSVKYNIRSSHACNNSKGA